MAVDSLLVSPHCETISSNLDSSRALLAPFLPLHHVVDVSSSILHTLKVSFPTSPSESTLSVPDLDFKFPLKVSDAAVISTVTGGDVVNSKQNGTYVFKPFLSPKSKKLKTAVVFVPRLSPFDIENERSNQNEFRVRAHPRLRTPALHTTFKTGVLHALLDLDLHMGNSHIRPKHRNTRRAAQLPVCHHVLERCAHVGSH